MLAFPMPRLPSPIPDGNRFTRQANRCHSLSTSHKPVLSPLYFHGLTNCFSRKPFALINICVAPRVSPPIARAIQEFTSGTNQLFYRHTVMNSLSLRKKNHLHWNQQLPHSFTKIPGVGWYAHLQNQRGLISRWEGWNGCLSKTV